MRFGGSDNEEIQERVATALLNKGVAHGQRGESEAEFAAYEDLVVRFGGSDNEEIQERVATALLNKGVAHGQRGESEAEFAAYENLVLRYGGSDNAEIQELVATALFNKGLTHDQRGESEAEFAAYEDLIVRFGGSDIPEIQLRVATSLLFKGNLQIEIGRAEEALRASDELDRRCGAIIDNNPMEGAFLRWLAKLMRTHALFVQKEHPPALIVFKSVCAMFVVGDERMLREMLVRVPILIAAGASERDLVRILSEDSKTAAALKPLVVALRQLAGESVRASAEVLEVAADVRKRIETAKRHGAGRGVRSGG